jgi:16S rRNA (guanine966-N2)-methyltransferase
MFMRIIAGEFRGRILLAPDTKATRPITDRAKQSLFDILAPYLGDALVYDCFAGTGSLGLESLSRGARFVTFFESDRSALKLLRENLRTLGVEDRGKIIAGDLLKWAEQAPRPAKLIDVIYLDPPYRLAREEPEKTAALAERLREHLAPDGIMVFRHEGSDDLELPGLRRYDVRDYGSMRIELLTHTDRT